jgi:hypothetical protein
MQDIVRIDAWSTLAEDFGRGRFHVDGNPLFWHW